MKEMAFGNTLKDYHHEHGILKFQEACINYLFEVRAMEGECPVSTSKRVLDSLHYTVGDVVAQKEEEQRHGEG